MITYISLPTPSAGTASENASSILNEESVLHAVRSCAELLPSMKTPMKQSNFSFRMIETENNMKETKHRTPLIRRLMPTSQVTCGLHQIVMKQAQNSRVPCQTMRAMRRLSRNHFAMSCPYYSAQGLFFQCAAMCCRAPGRFLPPDCTMTGDKRTLFAQRGSTASRSTVFSYISHSSLRLIASFRRHCSWRLVWLLELGI